MNDAKASITRAEKSLKMFSDELKDLELSGVNLETNDALGTTDMFFDNIFSDLMMQNRIEMTQAEVDQAIRRVEKILQWLR